MARLFANENLPEPVSPLDRHTLVAKLPVEGFVRAVLPRLPRIDARRLDLRGLPKRFPLPNALIMAPAAAGLEGAGLVKRRPDAADARAVTLEPTARGTKVLQEGRRRRVERLAAALQAVDAAELEVLARAAAIVERVSAAI